MRTNWPYDAIAEFYDVDMAQNADIEGVAYYRAACLANCRDGGRMLELGCGTGRITLALCEAGLDVVGVDVSVAMLRVLRRKAGERRLPRPPLLAAMDMAQLAVRGRFDVVLCPFSAFTYLVEDGDRERALASIRGALGGGRFVLDVFIPDPEVEGRAGEEVFDYRRQLPDGRWLERRKTLLRDSPPGVNRIIRRYNFLERDGGCSSELVTESRQCSYRPGQWLEILGRAGFRILSAAGDFAGMPLGAASRSLVVEAEPA